jgi:glyoxylase-like metal-dependent hydrolase (beta-lactamase superfamily II)
VSAASIDFVTDRPITRVIDVAWIHGSGRDQQNTDPEIQVFGYDEHTFILRQNMSIDREAPFLFLLFGNQKAVLIDTGATAPADVFPLRRVVDGLIEKWRAAHPRPDYGLLVLHSHAHYDHIAADAQFVGRPDTQIVGADLHSVREYFGFDENPGAVAHVDLGGRVLECFSTPGHHETSVTYYDRYAGLLLTGDTVYPGRLYVNDWPAFVGTIDRLLEICRDRPVVHLLGCHIEMSTQPGVDYPVAATYQPDEVPLQMTVDQLRDIRAAIDKIGETLSGRQVFDDFIICVDTD